MKSTGTILDILASLLAIGAGGYLLAHHAPPVTVGGSSGQSWLEVLAHGIGVYFIAKGIWMARSLHLQTEQRNILVKIVELVALARGGGGRGGGPPG